VGGQDGGTQTAQDNLAQIDFSVNVQPTAPAPEPQTLGPLVAALLLFGCLRLTRRRSVRQVSQLDAGGADTSASFWNAH
jgi:hypothetical protein